MHLTTGPAGPTVAGDARFPVNKGALCVKGWSALETLDASRSPADAARARNGRQDEPARAGELGRRPRTRRPPLHRNPDALRSRRGRRVRRRFADQREGVSARQVRPGGARHVEHRLQRPLLHVVRGRGGDDGVRARSRVAVSAARTSRTPRRFCWPAPTSPRRCRR